MTCINEILLQNYIDGECSESERTAVNQHLAFCLSCRRKHAEMEKLSGGIKRAVNSLIPGEVEIPAFQAPGALPPKRPEYRNLIIYNLAAAAVLLFVLFIVNKKTEAPRGKITIVQIAPMDVDANRPAGDQDFVIEVFDDKGQRSEYLLNH